VFFAGEKESFISYTFPIEFRDLPKNFELVKISAQKAEVQISGSRRLLLALKPEQVALSLDLENSEAGKSSFPLTSKNLSIPPGLNVIKIEPDSVTVVMEERTTALVPVVADLVGTLPEGKEMLSYKGIPDKVTIVGAPSVLRGIFSVKTEPILLSSITESTTVEVGVIPSPASVKLSSESPTVVEVELVIKDKVKKGRVKSGGRE
jgi:YbbR domain-containing protein